MSNQIQNLPLHVAITMDGNGRWATNQNLPRTSGHNEGLKVAKRIVKAASDLGIKYLTLYVFSTENWKRAQEEVGFLMNLIHVHLKGELKFYKENKIRINHIGDLDSLPQSVQKDIIDSIEETKNYDGLTVNLAINYGGRDEIIRGIKKIIKCGYSENEITEELINENLDLPECPDVDLLIRTGGEQRLSNFMLFQVAYSEFYFTKVHWPAFNEKCLAKAILNYQKRNRRFGGLKK